MNIIGLNSGIDASSKKIFSGSCALIIDGNIEIALAEDRVSRVNHEGGFSNSLKHILHRSHLTLQDIDYFYISFYAHPMLPEKDTIALYLKELEIEQSPEKLVVVPSHHLSHAYLAYFLSPFDEAIIMVADNEGSLLFPRDAAEKGIMNNYCERNSYYWARSNSITFIERDFEYPGSVCFGKAYNKFNNYIGFGSYLNAGKTMGLSSYGVLPEDMQTIDLWGLDDKGKLFSNIKETYDNTADIDNFLKENHVDMSSFKQAISYDSQAFKNLAFFVQEQLNKWCVKKADVLIRKTGIKNVCLSGGVALNSIMNREIEEKLGVKVFAPPYPSDPGQALGNAIYGYIQQSDLSNNSLLPKKQYTDFAYLGTRYHQDEIDKAVQSYQQNAELIIIYPEDVHQEAARLLMQGKILALFHGRSEYGARALGNRSILATPTSKIIRDKINTLKGRELFRPLAPAVLSEHLVEYFDGETSLLNPYMLRVSNTREDKKAIIAGVVHVDGTARVQEVRKDINSYFHALISAFYELSGIPMVVNTSFNRAGEPIVESAYDAINSFLKMGLEGLICGKALILKV